MLGAGRYNASSIKLVCINIITDLEGDTLVSCRPLTGADGWPCKGSQPQTTTYAMPAVLALVRGLIYCPNMASDWLAGGRFTAAEVNKSKSEWRKQMNKVSVMYSTNMQIEPVLP